jgi:hypothetical protein
MRTPHPKLPNGVWGQIRTLLFHPETFFKALSTSASAWIFIAIVLMLLTGVSEVQRQQRLSGASTDGSSIDFGMPPTDTGFPVTDPSSPEMPGGGVPLPPTDAGGGGGPTTGTPITPQLEQILGAGGSILGMWLLLTPLLAIVPFFNRTPPRWSRALKVAIWASVPLGLMALLQLVYYSAGGKAGEPGLVGIVDELPFYASLSAVQKSLVLSAASKVTLFHGWTLALMYLGARHTLRGKSAVAAVVIAVWLMLMVFLPVATGAYKIEEELPAIQTLPDGAMPGDGEMMNEMPSPEGGASMNESLPIEEAPPVKPLQGKPSGRKG